MKALAKAVIAVMKEVKGMEKNSRVGSGNYAYNGTKDQDVKEVFNDAMAKNGLCVLPIDVQEETQLDRWEDNGRQKQSVFTKVRTKYLLLHESGESQELAGYGHGIDNQDKGAGKALTYALKNALLYTFLTPVGKIDDTETTHSEELPTPQPSKPKLTEPILQKVVEAIFEGKGTIEQAKGKYDISERQEEQIKAMIQAKG
tara:strand:+ start:603 stop:1205 length:603 start_codon:yes stop_codon:yes gene_type:complete